jgi:hypothetical protein
MGMTHTKGLFYETTLPENREEMGTIRLMAESISL